MQHSSESNISKCNLIEDIRDQFNIGTIHATTVVASGDNELSNVIKPMYRPGYGKVGRPIQVDNNYFPMRIHSKLIISQFSVNLTDIRTGIGIKMFLWASFGTVGVSCWLL